MTGWEVRPVGKRSRKGRWLFWLLLLVLPVGAFGGGWWWALNQPAGVAEAQRTLLRQLAEQGQELDQLRRRYAWVASSDQVGQQASEQNKQAIRLLEEQIFELQQELAFYKGVLAPNEREEGLRVRSMEIQPTADPGRYRYKVLLSRVGNDAESVKGTLGVRLLGTRADKEVVVDVAQLSAEPLDLGFAFRHFQAVPVGGRFAELVLPDDFEPTSIEVVASVQGEDKPTTRLFEWPKQD
ncbi:DUF6776 family protein [Stutzerimonas azotifigens]|uniref:DUF6776 family protein n=1 Tax=Stutzerimonas azotifigens TaxID=291995 RepID=UPI00040D81AE|nr:DUF6776 family protein [Stutzerimonas azotifigens]